ncbi:unnamed protein product [Prorocentrum cordatum]|uniref:Uncharacterized protein n=1 Tax=Prorocentrum cordatum TaxID=2364126 RepID=A0ABN9WN82_9DINO|nr:unnamed protein product [Polarella glacialis]
MGASYVVAAPFLRSCEMTWEAPTSSSRRRWCLGRRARGGCRPGLWPGQRFELRAGGRVERLRHWGDNGRKRWAARCLDSQPVEMEDVVVADCAEDIDDGEVWEPLWEEVPLETRLYWAARAS